MATSEWAAHHGVEPHLATIADVAKLAAVSTATVSRVLNGKPNVNAELSRRVQEAAAKANYVPNGAGRALRTQRADLWAAIIPDVKNTFFTSITESFETVASERGRVVVLCNTKESLKREQNYITQLLAQRVSGVLMAATSATQSSVRKLSDAGIPVILFDRRVRSFSGDIVTVDNTMVGQLAAEHMLEQGVRRPLVVTGPRTVSSTVDREVAFRRVTSEAGINVTDGHVLRLDLTASDADDVLRATLQDDPTIDGVFAANGPLTAAAFTTLQELGRTMPDQVVLVGVDDDHWTRMVTPQVTVVRQPVTELGRWAARLLTARSNGEDVDPARIVLEPSLQVRGSSLRTGAAIDDRTATAQPG